MPATIGIIGVGPMGSSVGHRLVEHGARVLSPLEGRSAAARPRAAGAGMAATDSPQLATADMVLSIVPPAQAISVVERSERSLPDMVPKAYCRVPETREICAFVDADPTASATFEAVAPFYQRIADDADGDRSEVSVIKAFARGAAKP